MKKILFTWFLVLFTCSLAVSAEDALSLEEFEMNQEKAAAFLAQVPGLSSNEQISVYVTRAEARPFVLSFRLEESKVTDITLKEQEDWTLKAETTEDILNKILAAEDPAMAALAAINSKEIKMSGRTFGKKIKLTFLRMGLKLAGIFG